MPSAVPATTSSTHDLRGWVGAPVQLLAAGGARHAPLMTKLVQVIGREALVLECEAGADAVAALADDEPVIALIYTGTEIAQFRSRVLRRSLAAGVELASPREMRFHRLRREPRTPACLAARVVVGGQSADVTLVDLSESGCHLTCATPLGWQGTRVRLLLGAGDGDALDGDIRWVNQVSTDDAPHFACGIRFDQADAQRELLARLSGQFDPGQSAAAD